VKVSVILPTYNEVGNIVPLVAAVRTQVRPPWECEIIVVDDNSSDGTYGAAKAAYGNDPGVKIILRTSDRGLAKALRAGIEAATGDYLLTMDTDFTHRPEEIPLMLHVGEKVDLVSGSRFCAGGGMYSKKHYLASFLFNLGVRLVLRTQVQDNLCGFCLARADLIRSLPLDDIFFGSGDSYYRLLHFAQRRGAKIVEIPVYYAAREAGQSKSNYVKMFFQFGFRLIVFALKRPRKAQAAGHP
jgi:dolichol-phosphate mannosyltransferase